MTIQDTVIPAKFDSSLLDDVTLEVNSQNKAQIKDDWENAQITEPIAEQQIEIIELQANATVTPFDHDTLISDTFSDTTGYKNTVQTGTTTATFDVSKYKCYALGTMIPISYYKLDSNSAITDETGAHDGTNSGTTYSASGILNGCYTVTGDGDYINLNQGLPLGSNPCSISLWAKVPATGAYQGFLTSYSDANHKGILFYKFNDDVFYIHINTTGGIDNFDLGSLGTGWHHYVLTCSGTQNKVYVDGVVNAVTGTHPLTTFDDNLKLFRYYTEDVDKCCGAGAMIDEVGIWDKALSPTEVSFLYGSGTPPSYTDIISQGGTASAKKIDISLGTITGTVTATQLVCNCPDRESGDSVNYKIKNATQSDTSLALDTKNLIVNLTTVPTGIEINLIPKSASPTNGYPSCKSFCLKLWKS